MNHFTCKFFLLIGLSLLASGVKAQLTIDNSLTVEELVNDILLGDGVDASNITYNGQPGNLVTVQAGYFNAENSNIPITEGVLLATGNAQFAIGPNNTGSGSNSDGVDALNEDPDLASIVNNSVNDVAIIEFDFTVNSDSLKFDYIFASEEYNEFACDNVNDVFAFFLSGPGINGPFSNNAINIALVPGTNIPVSINTVNNGLDDDFQGLCAALDPNWQANSIYFVDNDMNNDPNGVQYDGFTVTLTAEALIECGGLYHIKMAIADVQDNVWDSGVFIQAGSFSAAGQVFASVEPVLPGVDLSQTPFDGVVVAGCFSPFLQFTRPEDAPVGSVTVEYGGTAEEDVDYEIAEGSSQFSFSEGVDTLNFFINTFPNPAAADTVFLEFYISYEACGGTVVDTISIPIIQPYEINGTGEDVVVICPADSVVVTAQGIGGVEPYDYNWVGINPGASVLVGVPEVEQYFVYEILDQCEFQTIVDSVLVTNNIPDPLQMNIPQPTAPLCPSEPVLITAVVANGNGEYFFDWDPVASVTNSVEVSFVLPTEVTLTVTDSCGTQVRDSVFIEYPQYDSLQVTFTRPTDNCPDGPLELEATVTGGGGDIQFNWTQDEGEGEFVNSNSEQLAIIIPRAGKNIYTIEVTDRCHRLNLFGFTPGIDSHTDSLQIIYLDDIPNVITPNNDGMNDIFVIEGIQEFENARVEIYDRWGRMIFESASYPAGDPMIINSEGFGGADIKDGTYFYVVNIDSGECVKSGNLQVLAGQD